MKLHCGRGRVSPEESPEEAQKRGRVVDCIVMCMLSYIGGLGLRSSGRPLDNWGGTLEEILGSQPLPGFLQ